MSIGSPTLYQFMVWPLRILWILILLGAVYFVGVNIALNVPVTQDLINRANPERLQVRWQKAWSLWPVNLHLQGVEASGQAGLNRWAFAASEVSSSLDVVALLDRHLHASSGRVHNPVFMLEKNPDRQLEGRPENRQQDARDSGRKGWWVDIDEAEITGTVDFSVPRLRGKLKGRVATGLSYRTDTGELHLHDGVLETEIDSLVLDDGSKLVDHGQLDGKLTLGPYLVRDHPGKQMLRYLETTARVSFDSDSLAFLDPYLVRFEGLDIDGSGRVEGDVRIGDGRFQPGSRLSVTAPALAMTLFDFSVDGTGEVVLETNQESKERMDATVLFTQLAGYSQDRQELLVEGQNLRVEATAPSTLLIDKQAIAGEGSLSVSVEKIAAPDITVYQRYIPSGLPLTLKQGQGTLRAELTLDQQQFNGQLTLTSESATIGMQGFEVESGLEIVVQAAVESFDDAKVDISGTAIRLSDTDIAADQQQGNAVGDQRDNFTSSLVIDRGELRLDESRFTQGAARWRTLIKNRDIDGMLENAGSDLHLLGTVSSLDWINALIDNPYGLEVAGNGALDITLLLDDGNIKPGSALAVTPDDLQVRFLDYAVTGAGSINLSLEGAADSPDLDIRLEVLDARFGRKDEADSHIEVDQVLIEANAQQVGLATLADSRNSAMKMRLYMPSARVPDMAAYNSYLPKSSPLRLIGGSADLAVDVTLEPTDASGSVVLHTDGLGAAIDDQEVAAELEVDILLGGGVPADMEFDISGSTIVIDQVRVKGDAAAFGSDATDTEPWNITLDLEQGKVRWKKPLEIDAELNLQMKDTLPMVAVLANSRGEHGWLEKLLTIEDVRGSATLSVQDQRINVPYLMVEADDIRLGAKAGFEENKRAGVVYARYKKLHGLLKFAGGKRNFDILKARKQFDEFDVATAKLVAVPPPKSNGDSAKAGNAANRITGDARSDEGNIATSRNTGSQSKKSTAEAIRGSSVPPKSASRSKQWQPFENTR